MEYISTTWRGFYKPNGETVAENYAFQTNPRQWKSDPSNPGNGKNEDELTGEEDFELLWVSTEAEKLHMHLLTATEVTDQYLGLNKEKKKRRVSCVII